MRTITPIITLSSAAMLLLFAYAFGPWDALLGDAALLGVPLWLVSAALGAALLVVTGDQWRRRPGGS